MRTPEEKILRAIGSIQNEELIESSMPKQRFSLIKTERRELTEITVHREQVGKMYWVKRAVIGLAAAAVVITGAVVLWKYLQNDFVEPSRQELNAGTYNDYDDLPVLPDNSTEIISGRNNVLLYTVTSGDGDSGLKYKVELMADNVYQDPNDPYMLICDPYAIVTDVNSGRVIGKMGFYRSYSREYFDAAKKLKYSTAGSGMDWLRADVTFMYVGENVYPLFSTQCAADTGGMYTAFYGIDSMGLLRMYRNTGIDRNILSEGSSVGVLLSGYQEHEENRVYDIRRDVTFEFHPENISVRVYKGKEPPAEDPDLHLPVSGPSEMTDHSVTKTFDIQRKYISSRMPYEGEGYVVPDMVTVSNGNVYIYATFGANPYDEIMGIAQSLSTWHSDVDELEAGLRAVCDENDLNPEYLPLLQKADVYDYITNDLKNNDKLDFYYIGDHWIMSIGTDGYGTGVRFLERTGSIGTYQERLSQMRRVMELLWELAGENRDIAADIAAAFVDERTSNSSVYWLEIVSRSHAEMIKDYLTQNGAAEEAYTVVNVTQERDNYLPIEYRKILPDGEEITPEDTGNYLTVGNRSYVLEHRDIPDMEALRFWLSQIDKQTDEMLDKAPLEEQQQIIPYDDVFDPLKLPTYTSRVYYDLGTVIVEKSYTGCAIWRYDFKLSEVRDIALWYRQHPVFTGESGEKYVVDKLEFVDDTSGEKERLYLRITAQPQYHEYIEKTMSWHNFAGYYYEIVSP